MCLGRHTLTGLITTAARQFQDWSSDYRLYSHNRIKPQVLFDVLLQEILKRNESGPLVAAIDDTLLRRAGKKVPGVAYRRDPLGPPFSTNFILAQRFLQISAAFPHPDGSARMIPIDFAHAPTPKKPNKKAGEDEWEEYKKLQKQQRIGSQGVSRIQALRKQMDTMGYSHRSLLITGDGSYTNRTVLKDLPQRTTFLGRTRADTTLYYLPEEQPSRGRKKAYGPLAPTPEELRQDEKVPWTEVQAHAAGKIHPFRIKTLTSLRWRPAGQHALLKLVVIAPLRYRLSQKSRLLYRKPAYLLCTDPTLSNEDILQYYLWRWGIEVNFREQKTLLGIHQYQVRHQSSIETLPATATAAYGFLLLAGEKGFSKKIPVGALPPPKWNQKKTRPLSAQNLINQLRHEIWKDSLHSRHFSGFANKPNAKHNPKKLDFQPFSALFYSRTGLYT